MKNLSLTPTQQKSLGIHRIVDKFYQISLTIKSTEATKINVINYPLYQNLLSKENKTKLIYEYKLNTLLIGRIMVSTKDIHIIIPRTCECIILHNKRNFTDVIKDFETWEITVDCPDWPSLIPLVFLIVETSSSYDQRDQMFLALKVDKSTMGKGI